MVAVARRRRVPQLDERVPHVGGRDGVAAEVAEAGRPPFELLGPLGHEPWPVGDLPQEGVHVGGDGAPGALALSRK